MLLDHKAGLLGLLLISVHGVILTILVDSVTPLELYFSLDHTSFSLDRNCFISCLLIFRPNFPHGIVLRIRVIPIIFEKDVLEVVISLGAIEVGFNFVHLVKSIVFHIIQICFIAKRCLIRIILLADVHIHVVLEHHVYLVFELVYARHILMHILLVLDGVILPELSSLLMLIFHVGCR